MAKKKATAAKSPSRKKASAKKAPPAASTKGEPGSSKTEPASAKAEPKGRSLVIVESPAKAKTINKYLGRDFVVKASMGHVRDLPKGRFGIDTENGFEPHYTTISGKAKVLAELKQYAKSAPSVYLAPDLDREGEAIAWHLYEALELDESRYWRVVFNEITEPAIQKAFAEPGKLDWNKIDAQQARRVLDRIMGYKLSPLLWKKIAKGLSAGRVQSVAVRLIVEREKEIRAFVKEEYWRVTALFEVDGQKFSADLRKIGEQRIERNLTESAAREVIARIGKDALELVELEVKPKTRRPTPPFATSQLQQKAATMLRFSAKKTMVVAQQLYEGVEVPGEGSVGLITYMRTDSMRVSESSLGQVRDLILASYGPEYLPEKANRYATRAKAAQEAHEAIRPTSVERTPASLKGCLSSDQFKLYQLIWQKFVSSQMKPAVANITTAVFQHGDVRFTAQGEVEVFDGHLRVFSAGGEREEQVLPSGLVLHNRYLPLSIEPSQHFTQPPPRYSEATLVKELEKQGIGRPSTYAAIISTIQERGYVQLTERRFVATELGEIVTDQLVQHFADLINTEFTAKLENELDAIENGRMNWREVVEDFHTLFMRDLQVAEESMKSLKEQPELSDRLCDKCGAPMAILFNKRGKFLGCSRYPDCRNTMPVDGPRPSAEVEATDYVCPKCSKPMVIRTGKRGRFLACTGFPKCKSTASVDDQGRMVQPAETGIVCEKCGSPMVVKGSRRGPFLACSGYPKCRNAKPLPDELREAPKPTGESCTECGAPLVLRTSRWGKEFLACSAYPKCRYTREPSGADAAVADTGS